MTSLTRFAIAVLAAAFLIAHLPYLAKSPDDVDSVNFVLGVREFRVDRHQPHPPGSPVYIALGKTILAAVTRVPGLGTLTSAEDVVPSARSLALLSAIFGALAAWPLFAYFRALEGDARRALAATFLTLSVPLVWFSAGRAQSDLPGLTTALVAQALLVTAFRRDHAFGFGPANPSSDPARPAASGRLIVVAALVAGLAVGMHVQTLWLTLPLLTFVLIERTGRDAAGAMLGSAVAFTVAVLVWAVPTVMASGGAAQYLRIVRAQAMEDFSGVGMMATGMSMGTLKLALWNSFVGPWGAPALAGVILALGAIGLGVMLARSPGACALMAIAAIPYAGFHLVVHETMALRHAIPLLPVVVYLAVRGIDVLSRRALAPVATVVVIACLTIVVPAVRASANEASPTFRLLNDLRARLARHPEPQPVLSMHYPFAVALRGESLGIRVLAPSPRREWLRLVNYWRTGGRAPVWFLVEPNRTDLAAIDRESRTLVRSYRWPSESLPFLRGTHPGPIDWNEIQRPRWFVPEGWALTPELGGTATQLDVGPEDGPIMAYLRRDGDALTLMVGGRHLDSTAEFPATVTVALDGVTLDAWSVAPGRSFLRVLAVDGDALSGDGYGRLSLRADASDGTGGPVRIAIEQFDAQPLESVVYGYDTGWHEQEYNPSNGRLWRWTSEAATLLVKGADQDVTMRLTGESPLVYFSDPPRVRVRAGSQDLAEFMPRADFNETLAVPADALRDAGGIITIETSETFVPDERSGNGDRRRLGLRIYELTLD